MPQVYCSKTYERNPNCSACPDWKECTGRKVIVNTPDQYGIYRDSERHFVEFLASHRQKVISAPSKADDSVEKMIEDWKKFKLSEFAFKVKLGKSLSRYEMSPPHVKAARMLKEEGYEVGVGDFIEYIVTKDGVKPLQLASFEDIDEEKYIEFFKNMINQMLEVMGMDFDEITGRRRQLKMEKFLDEVS